MLGLNGVSTEKRFSLLILTSSYWLIVPFSCKSYLSLCKPTGIKTQYLFKKHLHIYAEQFSPNPVFGKKCTNPMKQKRAVCLFTGRDNLGRKLTAQLQVKWKTQWSIYNADNQLLFRPHTAEQGQNSGHGRLSLRSDPHLLISRQPADLYLLIIFSCLINQFFLSELFIDFIQNSGLLVISQFRG